MRIDIIVPNFDETSDEVTISTWYKKVGDTISKGEVIADAETSSIACGITSSYDCILAKILVHEGETINQGTKIAVIETDLSSEITDTEQKEEREEAKEVLNEISNQIEHEAEVAKVEATEKAYEEANKIESIVDSYHHDDDEGIESIGDSNMRVESISQDQYSSLSDEDSSANQEVMSDLAEEEVFADEVNSEAETIDTFANNTEQKFKDMMKNAETQALAEAEKLKHDIIAEAQKQAEAQAEVLKAKILKEYEDKAVKDANEMHQKIIQGSVSEAEATKSKLLSEAKEKALAEAKNLKESIINKAEKSAKEMAESIRKEEISKAKKIAEAKAESISKEIMEKAINESKADAKAVKKDILHSAHKHIAKEAENIMRSARKEAQVMAEVRMKELMSIVMMFAEKEAAAMRDEIIRYKKTLAESIETLKQKTSDLKCEFTNSEMQIRELMNSATNFAENEIRCIKDVVNSSDEQIQSIITEAMNFANNKAGQVEATILHEAKLVAEEKANDLLENSLCKLPTEIDDVKMQVLEHAKQIAIEQAKEVIGATNKVVLNDIYRMRSELMDTAQTTVQASVSSIVDTVKSDVTKSVLNELKQSQNQQSCECKCDNALRAKVSAVDTEVETNNNRKSTSLQEEIIHNLMNTGDCESNLGECPENWKKPKFLATPSDENEEIDLVRRRMAEHRSDAYDASVISTVSNEVDMSAIIALEKDFGKQFAEKYNTRLGFTPFFIKAAIDALKKYRIFNAHIHDNEILYKENFDISIITCGNDGVAAPVIRQADKMSIAEIEKAMITLSKRAAEGTLSVEEVSGGTFTVINAGIYGAMLGTDLLTPPQVASLSVHKMKDKPVATENGIEVKPMLYISLSYDHRASDTRQASEFLSHVKQFVEHPDYRILGLSQ